MTYDPYIEGHVTEGEFYQALYDKVMDLAKHTPCKRWNGPMGRLAQSAFEMAQLHEEADAQLGDHFDSMPDEDDESGGFDENEGEEWKKE